MPVIGKPERAQVIAWARDLYANVVDRKDAAGFAAAFTQDGRLRFANNEPLVGRQAIHDGIAQFFTAMIDVTHSDQRAAFVDDTLFLEAKVTYTRHDGKKVTVPAMTVYHISGMTSGAEAHPVADDCRIYVDLAPLFAPAA